MIHTDFKQQRTKLHEDIMNAIVGLMLSAGAETITFNYSFDKLPSVIRLLGPGGDCEIVKVKAVKYDGVNLLYKSCLQTRHGVEVENEWWSLRENTVETHIIQLYEELYKLVANSLHS